MAKAAEKIRLCMFALGGEPRIGFAHGQRIADFTRAYAMSLGGLSPERALAQARQDVPQTLENYLQFKKFSDRTVAQATRALRGAGRKPAFDGVPVAFEPELVRFLAPLSPKRILCMARNYAEHGREMEQAFKMRRDAFNLFVFMKPHTAVQGPFDPVAIPTAVKKFDYEIELGVVIGKGGKNIPKGRAMEHVAGYTIVNDLSDRAGIPPGGTKGGRIDWFLMKARDGFAPMGPFLLLAGPGVDPYQLRLRLWVNGKLRQNAPAGEMIYRIDEQIAFLSRIVTLEVGDVIATGSPAGNAPKWGKWLEPGDLIEGEIQGIGKQRFQVVKESGGYRT